MTAVVFPFPRLYAIVDAARLGSRSLGEFSEELIAGGVRLFQYRDKRAAPRALYEAGRSMAERVHAAGGVLIINDRPDVAWACGADGVHLGQEDLPAELARRMIPAGMVIGASTHTLEQLKEADAGPSDYVAYGPVFATTSKERPDTVVGLSGLAQARKATRKPLVAIGGITLQNAGAVLQHGADSLAVIGALMAAADARERARQFLEIVDQKAGH